MLDLIDADDAGLDRARSLLERRGGEADLWTDFATAELLAPVPEPRQMRDAMSFALHIRQSARGARAISALRSGGRDAFNAVMKEPLEDLPAVYRKLPIYYITNRFTVVGPGADGEMAALQPGDGLRARDRRRNSPRPREHSRQRGRRAHLRLHDLQ